MVIARPTDSPSLEADDLDARITAELEMVEGDDEVPSSADLVSIPDVDDDFEKILGL